MSCAHVRLPRLSAAMVLMAAAVMLAACGGGSLFPSGPEEAAPAPVAPPVVLPPAFPPEAIVGKWGYAAYHNESDRVRIEAAAQRACNKPYVISRGTIGVMMHLADSAKPDDLRLKGAQNGKTYIGPPDDAPGAQQDREVISFDGRVLILRWMDPEVQGRYGTGVYVRCGPRA